MNAKQPLSEEQQKPAELTGRLALLHDIGCKLSQSRTASGESIEEAVRKLKIRKSHLQALENGNWEKLPDDIYVMGFLRQYSQYLHVDLADEIHRLKNDQYALTKPLTFPDPPVAPSRRWAWLAGAAFVLLFILFNVTAEQQNMDKHDISESPELATTEEPANDSASSLQAADNSLTAADESQAVPRSAESAVETVAESQPGPAKDSATHARPVIDAAAETPATEELAPARQTASEIMPAPTAGLTATRNKPETAPAHHQSASNANGANAAMHHFRFDAVGSPVWLQISRPDQSGDGKGKLLKEVLLQPGFHTTVHAPTATLWITCGNAPALRISVDGAVFAAAGSLGIGKKVLRDYRFSIGNTLRNL